jgi:hypothetical protein
MKLGSANLEKHGIITYFCEMFHRNQTELGHGGLLLFLFEFYDRGTLVSVAGGRAASLAHARVKDSAIALARCVPPTGGLNA